MALSNTASGYGSVSRTLHWLTALFILTALALGLYLEDQPIGTDAEVARTAALYSLHKTVGLAAFLTALIRILWGIGQIRPGHLYPNRRLETFLGDLVHWLLYGALVIMPLSGWITHAATTGFAPILWPFGQSLPFVPKSPALAMLFRALHGMSANLLYASLALHVLGALKHALVPSKRGVAVEEDQVSIAGAGLVHVVLDLRHPFRDRPVHRSAHHLHLDHDALHATRMLPEHQQVGAPPAQCIFAFDAASAVHHALEKGL